MAETMPSLNNPLEFNRPDLATSLPPPIRFNPPGLHHLSEMNPSKEDKEALIRFYYRCIEDL